MHVSECLHEDTESGCSNNRREAQEDEEEDEEETAGDRPGEGIATCGPLLPSRTGAAPRWFIA